MERLGRYSNYCAVAGAVAGGLIGSFVGAAVGYREVMPLTPQLKSIVSVTYPFITSALGFSIGVTTGAAMGVLLVAAADEAKELATGLVKIVNSSMAMLHKK